VNIMRVPRLRILVSCSLAALGALSLVACGSPSSSSAGGSRLHIGSLVADTTVPYYAPMIAGEKQAAQEMGADIDIQNGQGDLGKEIAIVQQFITQKKDVLVLTASDSKGIAPAVQLANAAGIPVIANNTVVDGADTVTYVGSDNVTYGHYLGKATCQVTGGKGNIGLILGLLGSSPEFDRLTGIQDELKANCPGVKIVAQATASWDNAKALAVGQDFLNRFPKGQLDAILDEGPEGVAPAQYAKKNGRPEVKFIVGDIPQAVATAIADGTIDIGVWQDPAEQGSKSVKDAINWVKGNKSAVPQPRDYSTNTLITKANLNTVKPY